MKKMKIAALVVIPLVAATAIALGVAVRHDCPGTRVCPLTGEVVCVDRCPMGCCGHDAPRR